MANSFLDDAASFFGDSSLDPSASGSSIATPQQQSAVQQSDSSWLNGLLGVINTGASVYGTVAAAQAAQKTSSAASAADAAKAPTPVIGNQVDPGTVLPTSKVLLWGGLAVAGLVTLLVALGLRKRR